MKHLSASHRKSPHTFLANRLIAHGLDLAGKLRLNYLPPLMVYLASGISGLTAIVGTFFVKDYLGLSAEFLAGLGFWAMMPWSLKLPIGHLVDLIWRFKGYLVVLGASLIAASLLIMFGLLHDRAIMESLLPIHVWYVISTLLAPIGYVVQDVVADAMTVEAIPAVDHQGRKQTEAELRLQHSTMQTLGRVAVVGGTLLVAWLNVLMFAGVEHMGEGERIVIYERLYLMALFIPLISCSGVVLASVLRKRQQRQLWEQGYTRAEVESITRSHGGKTKPNWWILGGGLAYAMVAIAVGMTGFTYAQESIFLLSVLIILTLMRQLSFEMEPDARAVLTGTAVLIFFFRAIPSPGPGASWWMIDELGFDQSFMARLSMIGSVLSLTGLFLFRRLMAERSIAFIVTLLTLTGTVLSLPTLGMFYGLHEWTSALTGGVVDARFIAVIDTALESPLGQIAMVPMLAWIAHSSPPHLKATFFAVMASFTNLSLAFGQLGTKYLNELYQITREVRNGAGQITVPADYSQLGHLLLSSISLGLVIPLTAIALVKWLKWRSV